MSHVRQQVREYFQTALTGLSIAGNNVFKHRVYQHDVLPALVISTPSDNLRDDSRVLSGTNGMHELSVIVEAKVKANDTYDDDLDDLCVEVADQLFSDTEIGGLGKLETLQSTTTEFNAEGDQPVGVAVMTFIVSYLIDETDQQTYLG